MTRRITGDNRSPETKALSRILTADYYSPETEIKRSVEAMKRLQQ